MTFLLNLIAASGSKVEWSRTLMVAWLAVALTLSIIELFLENKRTRRAKLPADLGAIVS